MAVNERLVRALTSDGENGTRPATFDAFLAEQTVFLDGVDFSGCRFAGEAVFDGAVFRASASFDEVLFEGPARFGRARFVRDATFGGTRFASDARFGMSEFGRATFDGASFDGVAWFEDTRWRGRSRFEDVSFGRVAWFAAAAFEAPAVFDRIAFAEHVSFDRATFAKRASFARCSFDGLAVFMDVTFDDDAGFEHVLTRQEIRFNRAQFRGDVSFGGGEFGRAVWLEDVRVWGQCHFDGVRFIAEIHAGGASFEGGLWLPDAELAGPNDIGPLAAGPWLVLDNATFQNRVRLQASAERVAAVDARLLVGGDLRFGGADVILDGAAFGAPTNIVGVGPDPSPGRSTRLLSLRRVDVTNLALVDLDLAACLFDGAHHLDHLRIEGSGSFATSPARSPLGRGSLRVVRFRRWTRRQTLAEEHHWRAERAGTGGAGGQCWSPPDTRPPPWLEEHTGHPATLLPPDRIAATYRALRKAHEDAKNEPGAADFYYGEMEMRRHATVGSAAERLLLHVYWLISGYGLRAWRAVVLLVAIVLVHGFLFATYGFVAAPDDTDYGGLGGHLFALNLLLLNPDPVVELSLLGQILRITLRVIGPILLGLAVLAVRNRVKR